MLTWAAGFVIVKCLKCFGEIAQKAQILEKPGSDPVDNEDASKINICKDSSGKRHLLYPILGASTQINLFGWNVWYIQLEKMDA